MRWLPHICVLAIVLMLDLLVLKGQVTSIAIQTVKHIGVAAISAVAALASPLQ